MKQTRILMMILLGGLLSGCMGPGAEIKTDIRPITAAVKTGDGSPVNLSLKNEEFSYGTIWKVSLLGLGIMGILGIDCWLCKRYRNARKCK